MYYIAQPPPLVGSAVTVPGALNLPAPYGDQEEYGYRTTAGMGMVCTRTGLGQVLMTAQSGMVFFSFFRAPRSQPVTRWDMATSSAAFGATPTLVRGGLYVVDSLGNLTLSVASANDTTIGAAASSKFGKAFLTPGEVHVGQLYAFGFLFVTAAAVPSLLGFANATGSSNVALNSDPRVNGLVAGQSDLPASVAAGSVAATNFLLWSELS